MRFSLSRVWYLFHIITAPTLDDSFLTSSIPRMIPGKTRQEG
jgi:hypothetical protein